MLKKLKRKLALWLFEEVQQKLPEKPKTMSIWVNGEIKTYPIHGVIGLSIVLGVGNGETLASESNAVSSHEFWKTWDAWNEKKIVWEGTNEPFVPPVA